MSGGAPAGRELHKPLRLLQRESAQHTYTRKHRIHTPHTQDTHTGHTHRVTSNNKQTERQMTAS